MGGQLPHHRIADVHPGGIVRIDAEFLNRGGTMNGALEAVRVKQRKSGPLVELVFQGGGRLQERENQQAEQIACLAVRKNGPD